MKKISWLISVLFLVKNIAVSQYSISGKVLDSVTNEPLAFVNIVFNDNVKFACASDINGSFSFSSGEVVKSIKCSYVGYETKLIFIDPNTKRTVIRLSSKDVQLAEFKVIAGENPAHRIIRQAIKNRKLNNPEEIISFAYRSYNKTNLSFYSFGKDSIGNLVSQDTVQKDFQFIMESVSERKFLRPNLSEEIVIANRVSGLKNPSFSSLATQFQPFSFYNSNFTIIDGNYLNPISAGSINKYDFRLEDTIYNLSDTTFIISFQPQKNKNFDGLKGLLYINTNQFAIQNVVAEPFEKGLIDMKIQQKYVWLDDSVWFPQQLNFQIIIHDYPEKGVGTTIKGESEIYKVEIEPSLTKKDFGIEAVWMQENSNTRDSLFWEKERKIPLSVTEIKSYQVFDSVGDARGLDNWMTFLDKIVLGKLPVKFLDFNLAQSLITNDYEGFRIGIATSTNEKISEFFSVGGFVGYGLKDKEWKYGGDITLKLSKKNELELKGGYQNTLIETAPFSLDNFGNSNFDVRTYINLQKDRIENKQVSLSLRAFRYAKIRVSANNTRYTPMYDYQFQDKSNYRFINSEVRMAVRYAYKEKLVNSLNQRLSLGTTFPVLTVAYSRGFRDLLGGEFHYNKIEARIEASKFFKNLGKSSIQISSGMVDNPVPYSLLFSGFGANVGGVSVLINNSFQTVLPYEFISDRYATLHYSHNFGSLLFKTEKFKPIISVHQHIGFGTLSNPENHKSINFQTMEKGLLESGLQIDNIVRVNYFNALYLGLGAGVHYRYGAYHLPEMNQNFAFTVSIIGKTR